MDLDEDGWLDLYVANDVSRNALFRNRGNGTFEDVAEVSHVSDYRSSMGIAVGDWNGDGAQDLFLTHWLAQGNALYDNQLHRRRRDGASAHRSPSWTRRTGSGSASSRWISSGGRRRSSTTTTTAGSTCSS